MSNTYFEHAASAETIEVESEEDGFHLIVTDDLGHRCDFRFQAIAFEFAESRGLHSLIEWHDEGAAVRSEVRAAKDNSVSRACWHARHEECDHDDCECDCHTLALTDTDNPRHAAAMLGDE